MNLFCEQHLLEIRAWAIGVKQDEEKLGQYARDERLIWKMDELIIGITNRLAADGREKL
jgi:hypothetical protein